MSKIISLELEFEKYNLLLDATRKYIDQIGSALGEISERRLELMDVAANHGNPIVASILYDAVANMYESILVYTKAKNTASEVLDNLYDSNSN